MAKQKRPGQPRSSVRGGVLPNEEARLNKDALTTNSIVEVVIERTVPGGAGLAHAGGLTLFVSLAAPGDQVRVAINRIQGRIAFASITEIITPSAVRVSPPCPYFGRCGGCDFQQLSYEAQLAAKVEIIRDCLRRIGRIENPPDIHITASPSAWHYRARARWQYDSLRQSFGYYELSSHTVCDVVQCPVIMPALQETLTALREAMHTAAATTTTAASPYEEDYELREFSEFQAVVGDDDVALAPRVPAVNDQQTTETHRRIGDEEYHFDAECFFQINHQLLQPLVNEAMGEQRGNKALDLYCGVGLFTLPLARRFAQVIGVEANGRATAYAERNLAAAGLSAATVIQSRVGEWLAQYAPDGEPVDCVVLDPPRAGAEEGVINGLRRVAPRRIVYVSCDPATLARDLRMLMADNSYTLDSLTAFDLFPQTHHVETVAHLSNKASA